MVELLRETCLSHPRSGHASDFDFAACRSVSGSADGLAFDMHLLSNAAEPSVAAVNGLEAFFELSRFVKAVPPAAGCREAPCDVVAEAASDRCGELIEWASPRISFSHDFSSEDPPPQGTSRVFAEKRKWQGEAKNGNLGDGYSSEFEFSSIGALTDGVGGQTIDTMLSADELFSDGKLIPMAHVQKATPECNSQREDIPAPHVPLTAESNGSNAGNCDANWTLKGSRADDIVSVDTRDKFPPRHFSMELPRPSSSSATSRLAPLGSASVDSSPCASPARSSGLFLDTNITSLSAAPSFHKAGSKYTTKIKEFFKPRKMSSSAFPQLTRDQSNASSSTCRIPIPPRSFWPFLRSNSAAESKTTLPIIPQRSFSAGDINTSRLPNNATEEAIAEFCKNSCMPDGQAVSVSAGEDESQEPCPLVDVNSENDCSDVGISSGVAEALKEVNVKETDIALSSHRVKRTGSPGRTTCKRYSRMTTNFLKGSPGRRGGIGSFARANGTRIVLRNLERCTADKKLCREVSSRRAVLYPVVLKVSPVINVAVYTGKMPSTGMFAFGGLFAPKKSKGKDAVMNNWRARS